MEWFCLVVIFIGIGISMLLSIDLLMWIDNKFSW